MTKNYENKIFVPDGTKADEALKRTSVLCFAAHQDDTEFMAYHAIEACYESDDEWFTSAILTNGAGSPRNGKYTDFTDEEMQTVRAKEQNKAAKIGRYSAQIQLGCPSSSLRADKSAVIKEIVNIILQCSPRVVYTHNLADKHKTHVAVAISVIQALRTIAKDKSPKEFFGLEVWRGLDWVNDSKKQVFDASRNIKLASELMQVFDSQIAGGKRYDEAVLGRRKANATFLGSHEVDNAQYAIYGIDMSALIHTNISCEKFAGDMIDDFKNEVITTIKELENL